MEIGEYCFAQNERMSKEIRTECDCFLDEHGLKESMTPLAGEFLSAVSLPDTVCWLGSYAFYNCRNMERLYVGADLKEVNGDSFMNCRKLTRLVVRAHATEATGLPFILNQISTAIEVIFAPDGKDELRLVYPEYSESYEEIGPAHIFHLQVEGQGFRARKQFINGVIDLPKYDAVFENAVNTENTGILSLMAADRLMFPQSLTEAYRTVYEDYLKCHEKEWVKLLVEEKNEELLVFACEGELLSDEAVEAAVREAALLGWTRGSAAIIRAGKQSDSRDEYAF